MYIYKRIPFFSHVDGQPIEPIISYSQTRSDLSGRVVDSVDDGETYYYCSYKLEYGNQDPIMGADGDEYKFGEEYKVNMFNFLSQPYVFFNDFSGDSEYPAFFKALKKHDTLDNALRTMRINTARKLIKSGEIKPEDLQDGSYEE